MGEAEPMNLLNGSYLFNKVAHFPSIGKHATAIMTIARWAVETEQIASFARKMGCISPLEQIRNNIFDRLIFKEINNPEIQIDGDKYQ